MRKDTAFPADMAARVTATGRKSIRELTERFDVLNAAGGGIDIDFNDFFKGAADRIREAYYIRPLKKDPLDIYNEACSTLNETRKRYVNEQVSESEFATVYNRWKKAKADYEAMK